MAVRQARLLCRLARRPIVRGMAVAVVLLSMLLGAAALTARHQGAAPLTPLRAGVEQVLPPAATAAPSAPSAPSPPSAPYAPSSPSTGPADPSLSPSATTSGDASPSPASRGGASSAAPSLLRPSLAPLQARVVPDVFVQAVHPLDSAQVSRAARVVGATSTELVAVGTVALGGGTTTALGVDPSSFRAVAPRGTAESTPLWQSVLAGDAAVAHTVAKALALPLGGQTDLQGSAEPAQHFRVGAYATTGLPGVGVVVDGRFDGGLGLVPDTGLVVTAPGADPVVAAAQIEQELGPGVRATPLRVPVSDDGRLTWVPPAVGPITSGFGYRPSPQSGDRSFHAGLDIGAPLGAPIYAASAGSVVYAGPASGFGNEVVLQHADGVQTVYGHMERILVTAGSPVSAGQAIALVGSEGDSTGPHLHFEVHVDGTGQDPLAWLVAHGVRVDH